MASGAPALLGPKTPFALDGYLTGDIIGKCIADSRTGREISVVAHRRFCAFGNCSRIEAQATTGQYGYPEKTLFFSQTNGVGLGHAQRCTVIAGEMPETAAKLFAAFPSCVPLVRREGIDCHPAGTAY